ncbi:proton-translocating NADH-quinone oxidoreductase, chain M family protein [Orientia chuto str. Dubai]|uniref:NADH-quinone oxidoreductase subunit M n=1 Tax=Orientia chuto str. Dubai TaxID=1359168 RepID=A0A0F3MJV5_9RICK|nr:NADH-quinone oxidoreductase subunit M [Candidatus Orientia mediorientalis]KJV55936.1 proton-translocating NADH-quinone oxidoreductase, chain M family protein [Orientia chuto str. Dubai]
MPIITQDIPILSICIFLPLIALLILLSMRLSTRLNKVLYVKFIAVISSILTLFCTIYLLMQFKNNTAHAYQFVELYSIFKLIGLNYHIGIDGISIFFIVLTALLTLLVIVISIFTIQENLEDYLLCLLLIESLVVGAFSSMNLLLFFIFFEATLFPVFLIIGIWGSNNRIYAAFKFFLYSFIGSVFFLIAIIYIYIYTGTLEILELYNLVSKFDISVQMILWFSIFIAFAIKIPMLPLHSWLPDAHVEAPTGGSVMLAGILLKLGGFGLLRICLPMLPAATQNFSNIAMILSVAAIIYFSIIAFQQTDIKKAIVYSSIAHMGYVTVGIFSLNIYGIQGAIFQMLSHGLTSSALFMIIGILYKRIQTKEIRFYGGLAEKMTRLASIFIVTVLGSIGVPGTSGFIGEFLVLLGAITVSPLIGSFAILGILLGAIYMLSLYRRIMLGEITNKKVYQCSDILANENLAVLPLILLMLTVGIYPKFVLNILQVPAESLSNLFIA